MDWKQLGEKIVSMGLPLLGAALPLPGGAAIGAAYFIGRSTEKVNASKSGA